MDVEKLILCVKSKRSLWDRKCKEYHKRILVKKQWQEVATQMGATSLVVKDKWRNLRDNFRKELAKLQISQSRDAGRISKKPKWAYFEIMLFLKDTLTVRPLSGNVIIPEDGEESNDNLDKDCDNNIQHESQDTDEEMNEDETFRTPASEKLINKHRYNLKTNRNKVKNIHKPLLHIEKKKKLQTFRSLSANSGDSDYHFLMSLLPLMKELTPLKNLQMRISIQQLFVNEQMSYQHGYSQASPCETYISGSTGASQKCECSSASTSSRQDPQSPDII